MIVTDLVTSSTMSECSGQSSSKKSSESLSQSLDRQSLRPALPVCEPFESLEHSSEERKGPSWVTEVSSTDIALQQSTSTGTIVQTSKSKSITYEAGGMAADCDDNANPAAYNFPNLATEIMFGFAVCMTQFLAEYLISGFALQLPMLSAKYNGDGMSALWPAALLSLIMAACLLIFARISDMYGGYYPFMFGSVWLTIWTLIPGLVDSILVLEISRAMQGLALAAFMPSTFAIMGTLYIDGRRKRGLLCIYSAFNPLGFFGGFMVAGGLPKKSSGFYYVVGAVLSLATAVAAFFAIPRKQTTKRASDVQMDWCGSFFVTCGLILVTYALAADPYVAMAQGGDGFASPEILVPFLCGVACLIVALWVEWKVVKCPLLPFDFFTPTTVKRRSIGGFMLGCMCFYASFGVWLYYSVDFLQNSATTIQRLDKDSVTLGLWYLPLAMEGILLCTIGGRIFERVRTELILLFAALAWIAAPTLLATAPLPLRYWPFIFPSMLCASAGINLTFTVSCVFLSKVQPAKYQGLCGAVCSMLLGLALAFSLPVAQIVMTKTSHTNWIMAKPMEPAAYTEELVSSMLLGFRSSFWYATASAIMGLLICASFVRFPRQAEAEKAAAERDIEDALELEGVPRISVNP